MAFKLVEIIKGNEYEEMINMEHDPEHPHPDVHYYECDGCHEGDDPDMPENIVSMYVPYRAVKCDGCGQGWYKSDEELGITPAKKEEMEWNEILKKVEQND